MTKVAQWQVLNSTSFVEAILDCPSLCVTGQKNGYEGSSSAVTGPICGC